VPTHTQIPYWAGADLVRSVVVRGRIVAGSGSSPTNRRQPEVGDRSLPREG